MFVGTQVLNCKKWGDASTSSFRKPHMSKSGASGRFSQDGLVHLHHNSMSKTGQNHRTNHFSSRCEPLFWTALVLVTDDITLRNVTPLADLTYFKIFISFYSCLKMIFFFLLCSAKLFLLLEFWVCVAWRLACSRSVSTGRQSCRCIQVPQEKKSVVQVSAFPQKTLSYCCWKEWQKCQTSLHFNTPTVRKDQTDLATSWVISPHWLDSSHLLFMVITGL